MEWFVARLLIQSAIGDAREPGLCEEEIRLLHAASAGEAYEKAIQYGRANECEYLNGEGQRVVWTFVGLQDLYRLEEQEIVDGLEVATVFHDEPVPPTSKEKLKVFAVPEN